MFLQSQRRQQWRDALGRRLSFGRLPFHPPSPTELPPRRLALLRRARIVRIQGQRFFFCPRLVFMEDQFRLRFLFALSRNRTHFHGVSSGAGPRLGLPGCMCPCFSLSGGLSPRLPGLPGHPSQFLFGLARCARVRPPPRERPWPAPPRLHELSGPVSSASRAARPRASASRTVRANSSSAARAALGPRFLDLPGSPRLLLLGLASFPGLRLLSFAGGPRLLLPGARPSQLLFGLEYFPGEVLLGLQIGAAVVSRRLFVCCRPRFLRGDTSPRFRGLPSDLGAQLLGLPHRLRPHLFGFASGQCAQLLGLSHRLSTRLLGFAHGPSLLLLSLANCLGLSFLLFSRSAGLFLSRKRPGLLLPGFAGLPLLCFPQCPRLLLLGVANCLSLFFLASRAAASRSLLASARACCSSASRVA